MDQASIITSFEKGVGDIACLWAPYTIVAENKGWKQVSNIKKAGATLPIVLVGDRYFCDRNPELVAKFLRVYLRSVDYLKNRGSSPEVVKLYQKFMKEWCGQDMSEENCKKDIDTHPVWNLEEQLELFDTSKGESTVAKRQRMIAEFFTSQGSFKQEELDRINKSEYVTDKFLKMVKPIITD